MGETAVAFIGEGPALGNWKAAVIEAVNARFGTSFETFDDAQAYFQKQVRSLSNAKKQGDLGRKVFGSAKGRFWRMERDQPSFDYTSEERKNLRRGRAPVPGTDIDHLAELKPKTRHGKKVISDPLRALDPNNLLFVDRARHRFKWRPFWLRLTGAEVVATVGGYPVYRKKGRDFIIRDGKKVDVDREPAVVASTSRGGGGDSGDGKPRGGGGFTPPGGPGPAAAHGRFASLSRVLGRFIVKRVLPVADLLDAILFVRLLLLGRYKEALQSIPVVQYAFLPANIWSAIDEARKTTALDTAIHDQLPKILGRQIPAMVKQESERIASYYFAKAWRGDFPQPLFVYLSPTIDFVNRKGSEIGEYEFAPVFRPQAINWLVRVGRRARSEQLRSMEIVGQRPDLVRLRITYERPLLAPADLLWSYLQVLSDAVVHAWNPSQRTARVNARYSAVMRSIARSITALKSDAKHGWPTRPYLTPVEVAGASRAGLYQQLAKSLASTRAVVAGLIRDGQLDPDALTLGRGPSGAESLPELGIEEGLRRVAVMLESLGRDAKSLAYLRFEHDSYRRVENLTWEPFVGWEAQFQELIQPVGLRAESGSAAWIAEGEAIGQLEVERAR